MSRYFLVPVTITINVKVPESEDEDDARSLAETLVNKRISQCTWGEGNQWTATVRTNLPYEPTYGEIEEDE